MATIEVPDSVQAVLAARIDRLPSEEKRLLQLATVIDKDIPFVLLRTLSELPEEALRGALWQPNLAARARILEEIGARSEPPRVHAGPGVAGGAIGTRDVA